MNAGGAVSAGGAVNAGGAVKSAGGLGEVFTVRTPLSRRVQSASEMEAAAACEAAGVEAVEAGELLTGDVCARVERQVEGVALWSAECPALYTVLLELYADDGRLVDCECVQLGVRVVCVEDGQLKLNGRPLTLRGVNRHEHCPQARTCTHAHVHVHACMHGCMHAHTHAPTLRGVSRHEHCPHGGAGTHA